MSIELLLIFYLVVNVIAFISMMLDKWFAIKQKWRLSEFYLLSVGVLGGSVGMTLGMICFKHKLSKLHFRFVGTFMTLVHYGLFSYMVVSL